MNKKALLIAFHFPPQAASSGIQRTLSFSRHLRSHGWEPLVLSAHPRAYSVKNPSQLAAIPEGMVVRRPFALDSKHHLGIKGRYPEILALPDRWISWFFAAVPAGLKLIKEHKPEVIWSTFPIATSHLIALTLHRLTGLPWIADFRDPMLQPSYPNSRNQRAIFGWIERQAIQRCKRAVFTTYSARDACRARFPDVSPDKFIVIENGYDEDGFDGAPSVAETVTAPRTRVTLLHSGVLYDSGRDPSAFLQAIANLHDQGRISGDTVKVILRAPGDIPAMEQLVSRFGVTDIVEVAGPVPYREALAEMLSVDALLVFQGTPFNTQIPAKIYEYFRSRKPILGLVDPAGETARVLDTAGFRSIAQMDSATAITPVLDKFITQVRDGDAHTASEETIASSSRTHRAGQLAGLFNQV
jgi:glycosyltransferase involved in cell wall biosynthesis